MATKTLAKLKTEVTFNRDLTHLVDVMKNIAASQYHIMERKRTGMGGYKKALDELFSVYDFRSYHHPFVRPLNTKKLVVLVTTDFGFLGGLNMKVINAGVKFHEKSTQYLVIGDRGVNVLREYGYNYTPFPGVSLDEGRFELVAKVQRDIFRWVVKNKYGQVILVFPHSTSIGTQKLMTLNMIPCPLFYKNRTGHPLGEEDQKRDVILECSANGAIESLTECWMKYRLIEIFESAKLAEFGARMVHLEDSFQTLTKIDKQLKLEYFKLRREKIDQSLRETATAQIMLSHLEEEE